MAYRFALQTMSRTVFIAAVYSTLNAGNQRTKNENNGTSNSIMGSKNANNGSAGAVCAGVYAAQSGRRLRHRRPTLLLDRTSVLPSATQHNMLQRSAPCRNTLRCCTIAAACCMLKAVPYAVGHVSSQLHDVSADLSTRCVPLRTINSVHCSAAITCVARVVHSLRWLGRPAVQASVGCA